MKLDSPMLNISILKTRKYATAVIIIVIVQAALMGTGVITPLYIQGVRGYSATMSGVAMLPGAVIGAFLGLLAGRLFDRLGVRKVVIPGVIVALIGAAGLALLAIDSDFWFIMLAYTVLTAGLQFTMTPLNTWGVNSLDNSVIQHAQGLSNTLNQVAASLGTAVLVSISALAPIVAPNASGIEQMYLGNHMAFCTTATLMVVAGIVILFFVRDNFKQKGAQPVGAEARGETAEGNAPIAYSAGFDGVTVDGLDEAIVTGRYENLVVSDAMTREPLCASASATMADVVRLMAANDTSGLPVVGSNGELVGFISDGDVASYLGRNDVSFFDTTMNLYRFSDDAAMQARLVGLMKLNVMDIATKHVISVEENLPLDKALHVLSEKRIKKVPVINDKGRLVGTLSRRNIINSLVYVLAELEQNEQADKS